MTLKPVIPFEPIYSDKIPFSNEWIAQVKWDGVRVLTYYDGIQVKLFNRRCNERTMQYPELIDIKRYCSASSVILDGEIIALDKGLPTFHKVMKRDGIRKAENVASAKQLTPITYMLFDILYFNGEWITEKTFKQRNKLLLNTIIPQDDIQVVKSFNNIKGLFEAIKAKDLEGIVCKDINSQYKIGGADKRWQKIKNYKDLIAVVGGVTMRDEIVNALLLGLYDKTGNLWYIGHAGTGNLTSQDWKELTAQIKPLIIKNKPFINAPERAKSAIWIKPELTVKIKYIEWPEGHTLRQPSIQAIVHISPSECTLNQ